MIKISRILDRLYTLCWKYKFEKFGNSVIKRRIYHLVGLKYISVGNNTVFDSDIQLTAWKIDPEKDPSIMIGDDCLIRKGAHISAVNSIVIGNKLLTGTNILITDNSHGKFEIEQLDTDPKLRPLYSKGPVIIGNNVWLGNNVCIMPGVTIGDGVIIGANSVVTHDIPSYSLAAGIPAKVIKTISNEK